MREEQFAEDPGFGKRHEGRVKRLINRDGTFNIIRKGVEFHFADTYIHLIRMSWPRFILVTMAVYLICNGLFAGLYLMVGIEHITGADTGDVWNNFINAFFFSTQTFTTVGYGAMAPTGKITGMIASVEAMFGLLSFALATGLMYGRFSKPSARILFSRNAIIAPHKDKAALQFRMVNQRPNVLMEMKAQVLFSMIDKEKGQHYRQYYRLDLENDFIQFFPLNWTLVHAIDEKSPLHGLKMEDLKSFEAELLILISGFDDAFSQTVRRRFSYCADEIIWGAKFQKAYHLDENGNVIMHVEKIHAYDAADIPE